MGEISSFFTFSNPLFSDGFVALVLYIAYRLLAKRFPRVSQGIREGSLIFIVFMCYDASRYFALDEKENAIHNARLVIGFEKKTHIDIEIPLQKMVVKHEEFAKFLNSFYLGAHWGGLVIFFVWAYGRALFASSSKKERRFKEYVTARGRFIIMNIIAAISFIAYPCAPPRAIPDEGYVDTLASISHADVYSSTRRFVNPYAAMPSMHQGYSLLFAMTIVIMLRSEILASATELDDDEEETLPKSIKSVDDTQANATANALREYFREFTRRYRQYKVLSPATRQNERKLFLLSLLPFGLLMYPMFMFVVIVGTGNHFVLDALAGATAFLLAVLAYPLVARAIALTQSAIQRAWGGLTHLSVRMLDQKGIEMSGMKGEETKRFLAAETA